MPFGDVLLIQEDEWESALLAKLLKDAGLLVRVATSAREGFAAACARVPDCIVCDVNLPDIDGFWVARRVRTEGGALAAAPFVFLTADDDKEVRLQGFNVGADVYLAKPFRNEDVVAQVLALLGLVKRVRGGDREPERREPEKESYGPPSSRVAPAFRGDLSQMSVTSLLAMLDMERRTGRLRVRTVGSRTATFEIEQGCVISARMDDDSAPAVDVLRQILRWTEGRFWFRGPEPGSGSKDHGHSPRETIAAMMLEATRLEDEHESGTRSVAKEHG